MARIRIACLLAFAVLLAGCATTKPGEVVSSPIADAGQLVVVTSAGWNASRGRLRTFNRTETGWQEVGSARAVTLGRAGSAWGIGLHVPETHGPMKVEGDGRSPAGAFVIGIAFGYPETVDTGLEYHQMDVDDWCVDVSGARYYNRIVNAAKVGDAAVKGSTEPMRRDLHLDGDQRYRIGFVIGHNAAAGDHRGSCIFAHVWKSPEDATAGCTAMSDADLQGVLRWLDRDRSPRFVLLPEAEYARLQAQWLLP